MLLQMVIWRNSIVMNNIDKLKARRKLNKINKHICISENTNIMLKDKAEKLACSESWLVEQAIKKYRVY